MYTETCGCKCTETEWVEMCDACRKESDEISARWKRERTQAIQIKVYRLNDREIPIPGQTQELPVTTEEFENPFDACL